MNHGTYSTYSNKKCRCDECKAAAKQYNRDRMAKLRGEDYKPKKRGPRIKELHSASGYTSRGCRCEVCTAAILEYRRARKNSMSPGDPRHGTVNGYTNLGCRCDKCKDAMVNRPGARDSILQATYGLTESDWDEMFDRQGGKCASCGDEPAEDAKRRFHVDHDHDTGSVRGVLCLSCNVALGHLKDDPERIASLGRYLEQWKPF